MISRVIAFTIGAALTMGGVASYEVHRRSQPPQQFRVIFDDPIQCLIDQASADKFLAGVREEFRQAGKRK